MKEILQQFDLPYDVQPYGDGHINETYCVRQPVQFILQKLNTHVFHDPDSVMENIVRVTEHLKKKIEARGGDPLRETLQVVPTRDGKSCYHAPDGSVYRVYVFVSDTVTYQQVTSPEIFREAGRAFGRFQCDLSDFPADLLHETIVQFHDTGKRFRDLTDAIAADAAGRVKDCGEEIAFAKARQALTHRVTDALAAGTVPLRVTHNDTKLNNLLFDRENGRGLCVIDLDTVMPGSCLYDFGDSIRFGASTAAEDETRLDRVSCSLEYFEAYAKGFLGEVGAALTPAEWELLPFSALLLTFECGMRFLEDHLRGDVYFRIHRPGHNLDRARNQFRLVADMEAKMERMEEIVRNIRKELA